LLTDKQTDKQTKTGKNITSLAEVIIFPVILQTAINLRMLSIRGHGTIYTPVYGVTYRVPTLSLTKNPGFSQHFQEHQNVSPGPF